MSRKPTQTEINQTLILVQQTARFEKGAILTQAAYAKFLQTCSEAEAVTHQAAHVTAEQAAVSGLEFYGSLEIH